MPRRPTYLKKSVKLQVERLEKKCRYCKTHQNGRGFNKHEAWCKRTWTIRRELQDLCTHPAPNQFQVEETPLVSPAITSSLITSDANNEFVEGSSSIAIEIEYPSPELDPEESTTAPSLGMLTLSQLFLPVFTWSLTNPVVMFGPFLPWEYIKIIPHPHSPDPTTKIVALSTLNSAFHSECPTYMPQPEPRPWAPFENLADFEYTETAILGLLPKRIVNKQLAGFNSNWAEGSRLTIKNFTDMDKALSKARKYFVQVSRIQLLSVFLVYSES